MARVLHEAGYQLEERVTRPHPDKVRRFERARPNQLWQTDLFTFVLKRQNRRLHLVGFMDDHSRYIVGYGLHARPAPRWCWKCCVQRSPRMVRRKRSSRTTVRSTSLGGARVNSAGSWSSRAFASSSPDPSIRRPWARWNGSGARCGAMLAASCVPGSGGRSPADWPVH